MFKLRTEVSAYIRSCEQLISAATMQGNAKLTVDECEMVEYYAGKLLKLTESPTYDGLQLDMLSALAHHDTIAATPANSDKSPSPPHRSFQATTDFPSVACAHARPTIE